MIIVRLVEPIVANRIVGILSVTAMEPASYRFVFPRCPWIRDEHGERVEQLGGLPFQFVGWDEAERFQKTVLHAAREHAAVFPLSPKREKEVSVMAAVIPLPRPQSRELPSVGSHLAAGLSIIFLGTQPYEWNGQISERQQIRIGWELMDELMGDGRPFVLSRTYNYSFHPNSTLRGDLEGWHGRRFTVEEVAAFDMADLVGSVAVVGVNHVERNGNVYANVTSLMKRPAGTPARYKLINKPVVLTPAAFDLALYQAQPEWLRKKLAAAPEYQLAMKGGSIAPEVLAERLRQQLAAPLPQQPKEKTGDLDDEIPF